MQKYDVALSFAGEDRPYVEKVAGFLKKLKVKVFYDKFDKINLWGKDLYAHLDDVYRNKARYCVIFISRHYKKKNWTNHERKCAQARAFRENREYILPVRFDSTEIPGILETVGYLDLNNIEPKELSNFIIEKIGLASSKQCSSLGKSRTSNTISRKRRIPKSKTTNTRTKTAKFNLSGISTLPNDKPVVYKILTENGNTNFAGFAKRGEVHRTIKKHLSGARSRVPGSKVHVECMNSIKEAEKKVCRIIARSKPKYNQSKK